MILVFISSLNIDEPSRVEQWKRCKAWGKMKPWKSQKENWINRAIKISKVKIDRILDMAQFM